MNRKSLWIRFLRWLVCWLEIIEGLIGVVTLGLYRPPLSYRMVVYMSRLQGRYRRREED